MHLARVGQTVALVPRRASHATALCAARENSDYLPGIPLPTCIGVTADLSVALTGADVVLMACPAQALRDTGVRLQAALGATPSVRLVAKDGDVIWATTQASLGAKFLSAGADVANRIMRQWMQDVEALRGGTSKPPGGQE